MVVALRRVSDGARRFSSSIIESSTRNMTKMSGSSVRLVDPERVEEGICRVTSAVSKQLPHIRVLKDVNIEEYIGSYAQVAKDDSFHVVDLRKIVERYLLWEKHFPSVNPFFSVKTNHDPIVVASMAALGGCFDCSTIEEIRQVLGLSVSPERIIFANPRKSLSATSESLHHGVRKMVVDSLEELIKIHGLRGIAAPEILLRITTDDSSSGTPLSAKFGASSEECQEIIDFAGSHKLGIHGISFHVGSNNVDPSSYVSALKASAELFEYSKVKWNKALRVLDIGGGWPGNRNEAFIQIAAHIRQTITKHFDASVEVVAEPGRFLSMDCTTLVSKVISKRIRRTTEGTKRIEYYLNNGVFGFFISSLYFGHDQKKSLAEGWEFTHLKKDVTSVFPTKLWGPTLDSGDLIVREILLPELDVGDLILTKNIGSYGVVYRSNFSQQTPSTPLYIVSRAEEV
ncbi:MAG: type III PLP-dependent enzyme [Chlamydiales bacterium]|nr:type III PLP-dependent enzyme [Chlamydiales bacterium]